MSDEARVFVIYPSRDGIWQIDGAHSPDTDPSQTLSILKSLGVRPPILRLTITDEPHVGGAWPTVEDLTLEFVAIDPAPPIGLIPEHVTPEPCRACGGRGWHTAGGNDPAACACPAGYAWAEHVTEPEVSE